MSSRIDQITTSLHGLGTEANIMYTHQEIIDHLIELQSALAKGVFEKTHAENLRDRDIMIHFEALAKEYGLDQTDTFLQFKENMQTLSYTIGSYIKGMKGERDVRRALKLLSFDKGVRILYNVRLEDEDTEAEYDAIVITPYGLFVLEVKNWGESVTITQDGILERNDGRGIIYDLAGRMSTKQALLREYIGDRFPADYQSLLVFPCERVKVENHYYGIPVVCGGGVSYKIREFAREERLLPEEQIDFIEQAIMSHHVIKKELSPVDCDAIVKDYAVLMESIEEASSATKAADELDAITDTQENCDEDGYVAKPEKQIRINFLSKPKWKKTAERVAGVATVAVPAVLGGLWFMKKL